MTRYFRHTEAGCVLAQSDDTTGFTDELVEEISEAQYIAHCNAWHIVPKDENGNPITA